MYSVEQSNLEKIFMKISTFKIIIIIIIIILVFENKH